jgi:hypothetical protein
MLITSRWCLSLTLVFGTFVMLRKPSAIDPEDGRTIQRSSAPSTARTTHDWLRQSSEHGNLAELMLLAAIALMAMAVCWALIKDAHQQRFGLFSTSGDFSTSAIQSPSQTLVPQAKLNDSRDSSQQPFRQGLKTISTSSASSARLVDDDFLSCFSLLSSLCLDDSQFVVSG